MRLIKLCFFVLILSLDTAVQAQTNLFQPTRTEYLRLLHSKNGYKTIHNALFNIGEVESSTSYFGWIQVGNLFAPCQFISKNPITLNIGNQVCIRGIFSRQGNLAVVSNGTINDTSGVLPSSYSDEELCTIAILKKKNVFLPLYTVSQLDKLEESSSTAHRMQDRKVEQIISISNIASMSPSRQWLSFLSSPNKYKGTAVKWKVKILENNNGGKYTACLLNSDDFPISEDQIMLQDMSGSTLLSLPNPGELIIEGTFQGVIGNVEIIWCTSVLRTIPHLLQH